MKTKASLTLLQVLLPITLMLTSCASAPASSAPDSSVPDSAGTADTAAADMTTAAAAETDDTAAGASPAEAAAASGPSDGAFDPYALETIPKPQGISNTAMCSCPPAMTRHRNILFCICTMASAAAMILMCMKTQSCRPFTGICCMRGSQSL